MTLVRTGVEGAADLWESLDAGVMAEARVMHDGILRSRLRHFHGCADTSILLKCLHDSWMNTRSCQLLCGNPDAVGMAKPPLTCNSWLGIAGFTASYFVQNTTKDPRLTHALQGKAAVARPGPVSHRCSTPRLVAWQIPHGQEPRHRFINVA